MQQILADIETDAAGADDRDPLADRRPVAQHIDIRQYFGMIHTNNGRRARPDAGGDDDVVEALRDQLFAADAPVQQQLDASQFQLAAEVADGFAEFFLARNPHRHVELAADAVAAVEQRDFMTAFGGHGRRRQAGRAGADHRHAALFGSLGVDQFGLVRGARIDQATGAFVGEGMVEAGLIAADAGIDLVAAAGGGLVDEIRVGQERARHRDHVGVTACAECLRLRPAC